MRQPVQRISIACDYCRQKKLKCNGKKPVCHNCGLQGRECVTVAPKHKPRPTKRRIQELEEQNRQLRVLAEQVSSRPTQLRTPGQDTFDLEPQSLDDSTADAVPAANPNLPYQATPTSPITGRTPPQRTAEAPENDTIQYFHGPTSAIFDLPAGKASRDLYRQLTPPDYERYASSVLCAESARQRQLEQINFSSRKLDFDGVEPSLAMHLLSVYWTRQLHCGLIVYRSAFMRDMACNGPYFSKLLLHAIYFSASKHSARFEIRGDTSNPSTAGWLYRERFTQLLAESYAKSKITTIQALLIMAVSLFSRCDERSASWLYAGNAFNMIIDMGLHVFPSAAVSKRMSGEDLELRRRVFWGAYFLDKTQCLVQGRPPILRITDANVSMSFLDTYEELEAFDSTSFTKSWIHGTVPLRCTSTLHRLCELSLVMERILTNLYGGNYAIRDPQTFYMTSRALQLELEHWRKSQSTYIDFISHSQNSAVKDSPPLPHQLTTLALYNVLIILLCRPLIVEHHDTAAGTSRPNDMAYQSFSACLGAAKEIVTVLRLYKQYYSATSAPYLLSYATYICATILVRVIALGGDRTNATQSLVACLEALEQHTQLYEAASRTKLAIYGLMQRMGVSVELSHSYKVGQSETQRSLPRSVVSGESSQLEGSDITVSCVHCIKGQAPFRGTRAVGQAPSCVEADIHCLSGGTAPPYTSHVSPEENTPQSDMQTLSVDYFINTEVDREAVIQSFATNPIGWVNDAGVGESGLYSHVGHTSTTGDGVAAVGERYLDFDWTNAYVVSELQGTLQ